MKSILFTAFLTVCCLMQLQAQVRNLESCIQTAWENNIQVRQTQLNGSLAEVDLIQARNQRFPNLSAGSSLSLSGRSVDPTNNQFAANSFFTNNYSLNSNVLLYNGGIVRKNIKRALMSGDAARLQQDDVKQVIALQVANAYLNVLFAQENLNVEETRTNITRRQIDQLERLIAGGLRPKNDIYELKATLAANEQSLVTAKGNLELARLSLNQSMRIPSDETFELVIPEIVLAALEDPFQMSSEEVYRVAAALQPSLKNSALQVDLAGLDEEIAKASMLPSLGLGGSVGTNYSSLGKEVVGEEEVVVTQPIIINDVETDVGFKQTVPQVEDKAYGSQMIDNVTYGYGLSLTVPIYTNYRNKASIRRAQIAKENAILTDKNNRDLFRQQIEQAIVDARNSKVQYDAAQASVEASTQSLENLQLSFDQGNVNSFQLNIAADQYNNAQLQSLLAKYDYIFKMKIIDLYMGKKLQF